MKNKNPIKYGITLASLLALSMSFSTTASAAILFQDDTFNEIQSDAIKIGSNDAGARNTSIQFGADVTGTENGNITWNITTNAFAIDHTVGITGGLSATGAVNFSGATQTRLREDSAPNTNSACAATGEVIVNTTTNQVMVCTATGTPGTWANTGTASQDFESVYAADGDKVLTTTNGNFGVTAGTGTVDLTSTNTTATAIHLTANTGAGGITGAAGTGGLNFTSTGLFAFSGAANSTITTTGTSDITVTAGDDLFFDDAQLSSAIQLTNTATGWAATLGGGGIVDNINSFTETTAGAGASNIGLEAGSLTNVSPATNDVQAALEALDAKVGAAASNVDTLAFVPDYPNMVIFKDGSNNQGTLISDYDDTNEEHYYDWTSSQATLQDIDLRFRFTLPSDFVATGDFTARYRTGTVTTTDNKVDFSVTNSTDLTTGSPTVCGTSAANKSANAWATATITAATINTGCATTTALGAGDVVQVIVKLYDLTGAGTFADAGKVALAYTN
jgi:hypothetical protein